MNRSYYDFCLKCMREGHCSASCKRPSLFKDLL